MVQSLQDQADHRDQRSQERGAASAGMPAGLRGEATGAITARRSGAENSRGCMSTRHYEFYCVFDRAEIDLLRLITKLRITSCPMPRVLGSVGQPRRGMVIQARG